MTRWWIGLLENGRGEITPVMISATPCLPTMAQCAARWRRSSMSRCTSGPRRSSSFLQHRVKNILATVSSLATRMLRARRSIEKFRDAFLARLNAMGRTHDLLSSAAWSNASVRTLLETALEPYTTAGQGNVALGGDEIRLGSQSAAALGMVFHELVTNAAKYGALTQSEGHIDVIRERKNPGPIGQPRLHLTWTEHGGPAVDASATLGFGTAFITRCIEYEMAGTANLEFPPEGVRCTIEFPLDRNTEHSPARGSP